jgi:UDP-N-acetylglucosamine--N-acetylmuramyl-(pentapeptide) pyrophosphoryl-undecaprenol N-acetylglucosamine transferase
VAYDKLERFFPKEKMVFTGNPVRQDLIAIEGKRAEALAYFKLDASKRTLLVLGGSLGARRINQLIEAELAAFSDKGIQVIWQCGKFYIDEYIKYNDQPNVQVVAFIDRMDLVYAAADFVISRAGASSVSELCIVGKPVIYIPSPNVAEDHQTKNAQAIVDKRGALMIKESELNASFKTTFNALVEDEELQRELAENSKKLAKTKATSDIVDEIVKLINKK